MAVTDIVEGSVRRTDQGLAVSRVFVVTLPAGTPSARLAAALSDSDIPLHRAEHPTVPGVFVTSTTVRPLQSQPDVAHVLVEYGTSQDPVAAYTEWEFQGRWIRRWKDANDNLFETVVETAPGEFTQVQYHSAYVQEYIAHARVTIDRAPVGSVKTLVDTFGNTVNQNTHSGYPIGTLLCTGFDATNNRDGTERITCRYSIAPPSDPTFWGTEVRHITEGFWNTGINLSLSQRIYTTKTLRDFSTMSPVFEIT